MLRGLAVWLVMLFATALLKSEKTEKEVDRVAKFLKATIPDDELEVALGRLMEKLGTGLQGK